MTPLASLSGRWPAISALLDEALALSATEQQGWLDALEGERATHREPLRALLAHRAEVETDDFLGEGPRLDGAFRPSADGLAPGAHVGGYRLIEPIGEGGMSTVWLAERADGAMKRRVALKLPRMVWGDAFADRLAREREILSTLEHAHIARLYDAGVDAQGRPFLAMEYVQGETLDLYCRRRALPLRERLGLLLQVMDAVAHAHARLVVHRDLKPGNILVTPEGQVRLLDFGVAKLVEGERTRETALTALSGTALTPDYASPEQIRGEPLGTASDIYSMAVVAYELLSGHRPYRLRRGSAAELEEAIASVVPPLLSQAAVDPQVARPLRGDLDSIVNKALKKNPAERYPTMEAFAHDLHRYLAGEPVEARPDSLGYRARKFVGRHRLQVGAGGVALAALVAGISVALWQAHEARVQARLAHEEATTAQAVQGFLEGVFRANSGEQADPRRARETTARELLDRGAERIESGLQKQPVARLQLLEVLATMYGEMALIERQIALRRRHLEGTRAHWGADSDESVTAMAKLADALTLAEQRTEAAALLKQAAAVLDARGDERSRARFWVEMMQSSLDRRIDPRHGLAAADRALAIARRYPPDADLLMALQCRGDNAYFVGEFEQARQAYAEIVHLSEQHPPLGANELALMHGSLGQALGSLGRAAEAEASMRRGLEIARHRGEPLTLHQSATQLVILLVGAGRFREAVEVAEPAWRWSQGADAAPYLGAAHWMGVNYAGALIGYGRAREALALTDGDVSLTIAANDATGLDMSMLNFRTRALIDLGRLGEARAAVDRARSLLAQSKLSPTATDRAERAWQVASGLGAQALAGFQAMRVAQKLPATPDAASSPGVLAESAWLELAAGHDALAEAQATQALASAAKAGTLGRQADPEARATLVLGKALLRQQRAAEAAPVLERAVALHRETYDPQLSAALADALTTLAQARRALGGPNAGTAADDEARRIRARAAAG